MSNGSYVRLEGLDVYYEVHGAGKPLILLHGGFGTTEFWAPLLPALTAGRQVILVEQQGHGHTADRDAPLSYERMADDTAALLASLDVGPADVFGYSDGGAVAFGLAIRHPGRVARLATIGAVAGSIQATYEPETAAQFFALDPATFSVPALREPYEAVAPDPSHWPVLAQKVVDMGRDFPGYDSAGIAAISAPTLLMFGDSEGIRLEHAVELWRAIPNARLAIFPGADHFLISTDPGRVLETLLPFLDAPP